MTQPTGRWAERMAEFAEADKRTPFPKGGVVFTGASSIRLWHSLAQDMAPVPALNRGFGGAMILDVLENFEWLIPSHSPSVVVLYAGSHDVHHGASPHEACERLRRLTERCRQLSSRPRLAFISLKPSRKKWDRIHLDRELNRLARLEAEVTEGLDYLDIWTPMTREGEPPPKDLFAEDENHLSATGYAIWRDVVRGYLGSLGLL